MVGLVDLEAKLIDYIRLFHVHVLQASKVTSQDIAGQPETEHDEHGAGK